MNQKIIEIKVTPDSTLQQEAKAGVMYEHNATAICFSIDDVFLQPDYRYYLEFVTVSGVSRTAYLTPEAGGRLQVSLPLEVTSQMTALCVLNIVQIAENGKTEQLVRACRVRLYFSSLENTDKQIDADHAFSVNTLLEAIEKGTFKGDKGDRGEKGLKGDKGDKGDPGVPVDKEVTKTSENPVSSAGIYSFVSGKTEHLIADLTVGPEGLPVGFEVNQDMDGKSFSLQSVNIYAHLLYEEESGAVTLRIRTDRGLRYLAYIPNLSLAKGELYCHCRAYNAEDFMTTAETIYGIGGQGIANQNLHQTICTTHSKRIKDVLVGLFHGSSASDSLTLLEGSRIVITGVDAY